MLNFLVETKQEYTTQLINVLTPLIYEGMQSIYNDVIKISNDENILKNFQTCLQTIPKWNNQMIQDETLRILNNTKSHEWLEDLIRATLKSNIMILSYNPTVNEQIKIDPSLYQNIKIDDFIHKIYIETARELWNNPYLFYHNYKPIDLKRNQRETICLIKECIKEAIRKLLPVKHILKIYLGEEMIVHNNNENFEKTISEVDKQNLYKLVKKDLKTEEQHKQPILSNINSEKKLFNIDSITVGGLNAKTENLQDTVGSKILNIINNNDIKLTENKQNKNNSEIIPNSEISIINKNQKFQEVFSNDIKNNESSSLFFKQNNNDTNKQKAKFFSNYLEI
jgi:hypothetical protein